MGASADILVLCYHAVSDTWPAVTTVTPEQLDRHARALAARGYEGATFVEALTAPPAHRTVVFTFDDAHRSVLEVAAPILARHGFPGTVFVPTDYPDSRRPTGWQGFEQWIGTPYEPELMCLGWQELRNLADSGWEVGSHTKSHPHLTSLDDAALDEELRGSRLACEAALGRPCPTLAYPYGEFDVRVAEAARTAGYVAAASVPVRPHLAVPLAWPRVGVFRTTSDARFRLFTSATFRGALAVPAVGQAVNRLRELRPGYRAAQGR